MPLRRRYCVFGCADLGAYMHSFPHPEKKTELFEKWLSIVGSKLKEKDPIKILKNKKVCGYHFTLEQKVASHRLHNLAVPTLHLDGIFSTTNVEIQLEHNYCFQDTAMSTPELQASTSTETTNDTDIITHKLPNPTRFPEQYKAWCTIITGNPESQLDHNLVVCDRHFTDKDHNRNHRLNAMAVPSLFADSPANNTEMEEPSKCPRRKDGTILHSFPNPDRDMDRYLAWIQATRIDSSLDPSYVHENRRVCHEHFEKKFLTWTRRLSPGAVPTLLLPEKYQDSTETNIKQMKVRVEAWGPASPYLHPSALLRPLLDIGLPQSTPQRTVLLQLQSLLIF